MKVQKWETCTIWEKIKSISFVLESFMSLCFFADWDICDASINFFHSCKASAEIFHEKAQKLSSLFYENARQWHFKSLSSFFTHRLVGFETKTCIWGKCILLIALFSNTVFQKNENCVQRKVNLNTTSI